MTNIFAWTDSTVVLAWLTGSSRRLKTYVGNRVSAIMDQIPPDRWNHVPGTNNPADCASRGLFPLELLHHELWWKGPAWLKCVASEWPKREDLAVDTQPEEEREIALVTASQPEEPVIPFLRYSTFTRLQRVTAWILRFVHNCRTDRESATHRGTPTLTVVELAAAERYWMALSQHAHFSAELAALQAKQHLPKSGCLTSLNPFLDSEGLLRVGGRESHSNLSFSRQHPIILHGKHPLTKLIIRSEHLRMLHVGPTLLSCSLNRRFHVVYLRKAVRAITRQCGICRRQTAKPQRGQLPLERVTPGSVFEKVGVDYAGPLKVKYGMVRKTPVVKAYVCVFVSLAVKAVHLEVVSDLTMEAFVAALRRFIARRGYPSLIWSDHGTNFVSANRELKDLCEFLAHQKTHGAISEFCATRSIKWKFIPEHGPHFGGLWEAAVKSTKKHLRSVVGSVTLTYEELSTVLAQVEACLNSRPLVTVNSPDDDGIEVLTPGHFLIGQLYQTPPSPIVPSPCCNVGISVNILSGISGKGGPWSTSLL